MDKKKKILFISHDASLTGGPILLLNLFQLLAAQKNIEFSLILNYGGKLTNEFKKYVDVSILRPVRTNNKYSFLNKVYSRLVYFTRLFVLKKKLKHTDLIFSNTVANGRILKYMKKFGKPIVCYIHELESVLLYFERNNDTKLSFQLSDFFLFPSKIVRSRIQNYFPFNINNTKIFPYYFPFNNELNVDKNIRRSSFSKSYKIEDNSYWIAGMGVADKRKGIDIFIKTCIAVNKYRKDINFVWIGHTQDLVWLNEQLINYKPEEIKNLYIIGSIPYSMDNLAAFDLFFLSSREDPYPLVVIEAAYCSVPSVVFKDSGGIVDFISEEVGWVLESYDPETAALLFLSILKSPNELLKKGNSAKDKAILLHSDKEKTFATIKDLLN